MSKEKTVANLTPSTAPQESEQKMQGKSESVSLGAYVRLRNASDQEVGRGLKFYWKALGLSI